MEFQIFYNVTQHAERMLSLRKFISVKEKFLSFKMIHNANRHDDHHKSYGLNNIGRSVTIIIARPTFLYL